MPQQHLDRLSAVDAAYLHQEQGHSPMHIGGIVLLEGPPPAYDELLAHLRSRLELAPRYRQKVQAPAGPFGRERWVDDTTFNLSYHLRHMALPAPNDRAQLLRLAARLFGERLDLTKPLWELAFVEGLPDDGWALISKSHHALVDGVSNVDVITTLFDLEHMPRRDPGGEDWLPSPGPSPAQLAVETLGEAARAAAELPLRAVSAAARPGPVLSTVRELARGVGEIVRAGIASAPASPLNVPIGQHRRIAHVSASHADLREIGKALDCTIEDVLLAVVAGAIRRWMEARGLPTTGVELRAAVPISIRSSTDEGSLGNRMVHVLAPLPVGVVDPIERLHIVAGALDATRAERNDVGADVILEAQELSPRALMSRAPDVGLSGRLYNLLVAHIPGPPLPLYLNGRRLTSLVPLAYLAGDRALAVAMVTYAGRVDIGLLADFDALDDLDDLRDAFELSLAEFLQPG